MRRGMFKWVHRETRRCLSNFAQLHSLPAGPTPRVGRRTQEMSRAQRILNPRTGRHKGPILSGVFGVALLLLLGFVLAIGPAAASAPNPKQPVGPSVVAGGCE